MPDTEEIHTNEKGGKQSKLYVAYHLIDPNALEALAAIHHRGAVKYTPDNWRSIDTEEHLNHAMHHITQGMKILTGRRRGMYMPRDQEDHLAHALCRLTFALAMEIQQYGKHPEHSDPTYHEPKAAPAKRSDIRDATGRFRRIPATSGFDEKPGSFATLTNKARRYNPKRPSSAHSSSKLGIGPAPVRNHRRR
jgi:hypothetical protein